VHGSLILIASSSIPTIHPFTPLTTQDAGKWTALMMAAMRGHVEAVKALVAADPDPAHLNMEVSIP
jgi:ankyrin repeat protein